MPTSRTSTRVRQVLAAGTAVAVGSIGVVAVAPAAQAVSAATSYNCTGGGLSPQFVVTVDTTAPARMATGATTAVAATASTVLPAELAELAYGEGARRFDGTIAARITAGATAIDTTPVIPSTPIPTPPAAVPFTATSAALAYTAPATPGPVVITAEDFVATIKFYNESDVVVRSVTLTCEVAPPKKPVLVDTIAVVATSTTTLALSNTGTVHGQDVTATAKVTTSSGSPDGEVAFSIDGAAPTRVRVDKDGVAALLLPDASVGTHNVTATFVPRDTATYDGSASAPASWLVVKASTRMRVPVTGKKTSAITRVGVRTKGIYDTVPTGKVRIAVKRLATRSVKVRVRTLDEAGAARAGFGRLKKGRYQVKVVYRGDANHRRIIKSRTFRVTRG